MPPAASTNVFAFTRTGASLPRTINVTAFTRSAPWACDELDYGRMHVEVGVLARL